LDIKGKAAVVTGSSSDEGIGAACARLLAARGCNVVVNYASDKTGGEAIAAECRAKGVESIAVQADVSKDEDCKRLVQAAVDRWGRLDVLINNAATTKTIPHKRMDLLDADEFDPRKWLAKADLSFPSRGYALDDEVEDASPFPSDHHPKAGEATMRQPADDWHSRRQDGKWAPGGHQPKFRKSDS